MFTQRFFSCPFRFKLSKWQCSIIEVKWKIGRHSINSASYVSISFHNWLNEFQSLINLYWRWPLLPAHLQKSSKLEVGLSLYLVLGVASVVGGVSFCQRFLQRDRLLGHSFQVALPHQARLHSEVACWTEGFVQKKNVCSINYAVTIIIIIIFGLAMFCEAQ